MAPADDPFVPTPKQPDRFSRLGVVGDIHACDDRLEVLLDGLDQADVDRIVCVGDIVNGPGDPDRCVRLLRERHVLTVCGNHDRWLLEGTRVGEQAHTLAELEPATVEFLRELPKSARLVAADGTHVLLCHGLADHDMNGICADDYGYALDANDELRKLLALNECLLVLKGHRHQPAIWNVGKLTLVDAGSLLDYCDSAGVVIDLESRTATAYSVNEARASASATVAIAV